MRMEPAMTDETTMGQTNMQTLENRMESLDEKVDKVNENVLKLAGSIMPRSEIEAADARRVSLERFEGEMGGVRERLTKVESGPQRLLGWISLFVSAGIGCMSLLLTGIGSMLVLLGLVATVLIALIPHLR